MRIHNHIKYTAKGRKKEINIKPAYFSNIIRQVFTWKDFFKEYPLKEAVNTPKGRRKH